MKGILYKAENDDLFIEYEGEWQESTLLLMESYGDDPRDYRCLKEVPLHPDDCEWFRDYPRSFDRWENEAVDFEIEEIDDKKYGSIDFIKLTQ